MEEKKLTDEEIIHDLEKFASDSDMNETGIYAEILDLIHRLQNKIKEQDKEYIELDLECRELRTNLEKELDEHEEFTKKAKAEIERLTEENAELQKQVDELKERAKIDLENERNWGKIQAKQAVKDTAKEILQELLKWLNQSISFSNGKSLNGSIQYGAMNKAYHEVKRRVKKIAESKGVEVE